MAKDRKADKTRGQTTRFGVRDKAGNSELK